MQTVIVSILQCVNKHHIIFSFVLAFLYIESFITWLDVWVAGGEKWARSKERLDRIHHSIHCFDNCAFCINCRTLNRMPYTNIYPFSVKILNWMSQQKETR